MPPAGTAPDDADPGYWDAIIGPGKPLDTDRYFIISSDTLVNLNAKDPNTITTGPATIDPDTGKPYGMRFPIVTIRDFVNVQKALLDSLGIRVAARGRGRLHGRPAGARVGQRLSGPGPARGRGDRRGRGERLPDRLAEPVGGTDQARSGLERGRLLRPGGADRAA